MFVHLLGVQVREHAIADIFEDQRLSAVANNDPVTRADLHFGHLGLRSSSDLVSKGSKMLFKILKGLAEQR